MALIELKDIARVFLLGDTTVNALAGLNAGLRVEALLFLPGMAFNMSVAVLVGNSLGAGKSAEARRVALNMVTLAAVAMSFMAALLWPFRQEVAHLLSQEPGTQAELTCESGLGSATFVTGAFGFAAAGEVVRLLTAAGKPA